MSAVVASGSEEQKKFHSMCRWSKPIEEIEEYIKNHPGVQMSIDADNGNHPIHIAAQNGHVPVVECLIRMNVDIDAQNAVGNTALHMCRAYDYYWCARLLVAAGADINKLNDAEHKADVGIDGDKSGENPVPALVSAHDENEIDEAFILIEGSPDVDKGELVMAGMGKKKKNPDIWSDAVNERFKELCRRL